MRILVTGSAGFIGFHLCKALIKKELEIISLDNINDYYSSDLKKNRLAELKNQCDLNLTNWNFVEGDIIKMKLLMKQ